MCILILVIVVTTTINWYTLKIKFHNGLVRELSVAWKFIKVYMLNLCILKLLNLVDTINSRYKVHKMFLILYPFHLHLSVSSDEETTCTLI